MGYRGATVVVPTAGGGTPTFEGKAQHADSFFGSDFTLPRASYDVVPVAGRVLVTCLSRTWDAKFGGPGGEPVGWTRLGGVASGVVSSSAQMDFYWRVASGTAADDFAIMGVSTPFAFLAQAMSTSGATGIDTSVADSFVATATWNTTALTATLTNDLFLLFAQSVNFVSPTIVTPPVDFTLRQSNSSAAATGYDYSKELVVSGSTGAQSLTWSAAAVGFVASVLVKS